MQIKDTGGSLMESVAGIMEEMDRLDRAYKLKKNLKYTWLSCPVLAIAADYFLADPQMVDTIVSALGVVIIICWIAGHNNNKRIERIESGMKGRIENLIWVESAAPRRRGPVAQTGN